MHTDENTHRKKIQSINLQTNCNRCIVPWWWEVAWWHHSNSIGGVNLHNFFLGGKKFIITMPIWYEQHQDICCSKFSVCENCCVVVTPEGHKISTLQLFRLCLALVKYETSFYPKQCCLHRLLHSNLKNCILIQLATVHALKSEITSSGADIVWVYKTVQG